MKVATRRLLEEQIAAVVFNGRGEKNDAMWHVPQYKLAFLDPHGCLIRLQG